MNKLRVIIKRVHGEYLVKFIPDEDKAPIHVSSKRKVVEIVSGGIRHYFV